MQAPAWNVTLQSATARQRVIRVLALTERRAVAEAVKIMSLEGYDTKRDWLPVRALEA